ncbi:MAG: hypothetical protein KC486_36375 [Myxococcales bacterium]|nr:hypothetical protein [Myxococcales bacterium]
MSTETPSAQPEEEGSPLPAIIAGVGILGVAAFLIFGTGSGGEEATRSEADKASQSAQEGDKSAGAGGRVRGGIGARSVDDAQGRPDGRRNPAIGVPQEGMRLSPGTPKPKKKPESFDSIEEERAYYRAELVREKAMLERRYEFVKRLEKVKQDAASADEREVAESRGKIVEENYAKQQKVVEELEAKLEELGG